jgi:acyl transferase domain-containing protein
MRLRSKLFHPLLGDVSPDSAAHHLKWKNVLRPNEIDWLEGHQVQGQIVFPAAGYVSSAVKATLALADVKKMSLIEITDFHIHNALTFDDDNGVEVLIELSNVSDA